MDARNRTGIAVAFGDRSIRIFEEASFLGQGFVTTYEIPYVIQDGRLRFDSCEVRLGEAKLPESLSRQLWNRLHPQLNSLMTEKGLFEAYRLKRIGRDEVCLVGAFGAISDKREY